MRTCDESRRGHRVPITLKDKMKKLSPAQRKKVEARAAELIGEEMTLRELRHARRLTQVKMAKTLGVTQDSGFAPRKAERPIAVHAPKNGQGHGRESFAGRQVSRPCASGAVRHCRR
jgi:hypothetical protein